jgi:diguanylate cyclase (GGDEF)-like protein/PAS domain S-box-containing protein
MGHRLIVLLLDAQARAHTSAFNAAGVHDRYELLIVSNREEFIDQLDGQRNKLDLVVAALDIPGLTGAELLLAVRERLPKIPLILLSELVEEALAVELLQQGASDYLLRTPHYPSRLTHVLDAMQMRCQQTLLDQFNTLFQVTPNILGTVDSQGFLININPAGYKVWKQETADLLGTHVREFYSASVYQRLVDEALPALIEQGHWRGEVMILRADGSEFPATQIMIAHKSPAGELQYISAIVHDMSKIVEKEHALQESEARYRLVSEQTGQIIYDYDVASGHIHWAGSIEEILGFSADEFAHVDIDHWARLIHPEDREKTLQELQAVLLTGAQFRAKYRFLCKQGDYRLLEDRGASLKDEQGRPARIVGRMADITEQQQAQEQLWLAAHALENAAEAIAVTDEGLAGVLYNHAWRDKFGVPDGSPKLPEELTALCLDSQVQAQLADLDYWQGEKRLQNHEACGFSALVGISRIHHPHQTHTYYVIVVSDISRVKHYEEQLDRLVHRDVLTGLPNRLALINQFPKILEQTQQERRTLALLLVDLDRFKTINESLGHEAGDCLLLHVTELLSSVMAEGDLLVRIGGDEFALLLAHLNHPYEAGERAQRVLTVLNQAFLYEGHQLVTTASIGISCYPNDGEDIHSLLQHSEVAMYEAKSQGKNNWQFFSAQMNTKALETLLLHSHLHRALERQELVLFYQPTIDLKEGRILGVEALLRWRHPQHGLMSPDQFIPLAEETGLIIPMSAWVMHSACAQAQSWQRMGIMLTMAVNLSARQFAQPGLIELLKTVLRQYQIQAEQLRVEVTESMVMPNPETARVILQEIHELGVKIAIDDFGMGYSSLSYLKRFPLDYLKIDRSYVNGIPHDTDDVAIAHAVVDMAHNLGLGVVAEGVESPDQCRLLQDWGCEEGQGYLFSRPLDPDSLLPLLQAQRIEFKPT